MAEAKRVLILEDDKSWQGIHQEKTVDAGNVPRVVESVREAMDLLSSEGFDLMISDWGLEGEYAEKAIRAALARGLDVRVVSGTDDSTGRLETLIKEFSGRMRVESKL